MGLDWVDVLANNVKSTHSLALRSRQARRPATTRRINSQTLLKALAPKTRPWLVVIQEYARTLLPTAKSP